MRLPAEEKSQLWAVLIWNWRSLIKLSRKRRWWFLRLTCNVQEFQQDIQVLNKDKMSAANKVASLEETTYEWIESFGGLLPLTFRTLGADHPLFVCNSVILAYWGREVWPTLTIRWRSSKKFKERWRRRKSIPRLWIWSGLLISFFLQHMAFWGRIDFYKGSKRGKPI